MAGDSLDPEEGRNGKRGRVNPSAARTLPSHCSSEHNPHCVEKRDFLPPSSRAGPRNRLGLLRLPRAGVGVAVNFPSVAT